MATYQLTHLAQLEAEAIHIIREVAAEFQKPVMLYSIGKDSSVMLHLAHKAFAPGKIPFPLMHVDTQWKFREMYACRTEAAERYGVEMLTWTNPEGKDRVSPFTHGSEKHTQIMKTEALKQGLTHHGFDAVFGGARRDEEKSRAKERVFSVRSAAHQWDPKNQRPELWRLYNTRLQPGESVRVFPLSNWTEADIWLYILQERIDIVPLYFAARRMCWVDEASGLILALDDDRMLPYLSPAERDSLAERWIRFRTLGCYPQTGAVESRADTVADIVVEMLGSRASERQGRLLDHDQSASMERKKREGYF